MPVFHFIPAQNFEHNKKDFACPLYKAAERKGVLTTTCASSNYILDLDIPTSKSHARLLEMRIGCRASLCALADCDLREQERPPRLRCLFFVDAVLSNAMANRNKSRLLATFERGAAREARRAPPRPGPARAPRKRSPVGAWSTCSHVDVPQGALASRCAMRY